MSQNTEICRCPWANPKNEAYIKYHDEEWGVPVYDDETLFEFIVLESAQAGLSWETILNKRDGYRKAFDNFDFEKIAKYTEAKKAELAEDRGIVRNKLKIKATVTNAQAFIKIREEFGSFSKYIWRFLPNQKPIINQIGSMSEAPVSTLLSDQISKDMKKRGFKFFGTTICYAYMQATGMINDHLTNCFRYKELINT